MGRFEQFGQLIHQHMCIDLGRGDIGMAKQGLYATQVCPTHQKVRCIGVPQGMRMDPVCADVCSGCEVFQQLAKPAACQMAGFPA